MLAAVNYRGRSAAGFGWVELLVGLAVGSIVLAGALDLTLRQVQQASQRHLALRAEREWAAAEALMQRWLRLAGAVGPVRIDAAGTAWTGAVADAHGQVRSLEVRLAAGSLQVRLQDGAWQALTDPQSVVIERLRFETGGRDDPQVVACGGQWVAWQGSARLPGGGGLAPRTVELGPGRVQLRVLQTEAEGVRCAM